MATNSTRFTNTRYVDHVMLFAKSIKEAAEMVEFHEFGKLGLGLNTSKTKIIINEAVLYEYGDIVGCMVEVLVSASEHRF